MSNADNSKMEHKGCLTFVIDETNSHCGLTDRLKAAVGLCYIVQKNGMRFKFIHNAGFDFRDYLEPNKIDWSMELSALFRNPLKMHRIKYRPPFKDMVSIDPDRQYLCKKYMGKNIIEMTDVPNWQRVWRELFWDMFTPSDLVSDGLAISEMPERYVIVNARFINSLGRIEETEYNSPLSDDMQIKLIDSVLMKADECKKRASAPVVVYSDSIRFLEIAAREGFCITSTKGIGNMMHRNAGDDIYLKSFVGFFQIARAEEVYSIISIDGFPENSLYRTQYSRYAAIVGNKPFIRI